MGIKEYVISEWENYKEKVYIRDKDILKEWEEWRKRIIKTVEDADNNQQSNTENTTGQPEKIEWHQLKMEKPVEPPKDNKTHKQNAVYKYMLEHYYEKTLGYFLNYSSKEIIGKGQFAQGNFSFAAKINTEKVYHEIEEAEYNDFFEENGMKIDAEGKNKKNDKIDELIKKNIVYIGRDKKILEETDDKEGISSVFSERIKKIKDLIKKDDNIEALLARYRGFEKDETFSSYIRRKILFFESAREECPEELRYLLPSIKKIDQKLKKIMETDNVENNWVSQGKTIIEGVYKLINEGKTEDKVVKSLENTRRISEMLWNLSLDERFKDIESKIHKQVIYTGAPGTGKTYGIKNYIRNYCDFNPLDKEIVTNLENGGKKIKHYEFVQFHSSYDYSDFVEGLRPVQIKEDQPPTFVRMDGIFKEFCRNVVAYNKEAENTDSDWFFIIDEINRADIGKVFGELMYCLEEDYRGENNAVSTQYKNLPTYIRNNDINAEAKFIPIPIEEDVFENGFYIPENVHIIGSMNDIDRSVETFDFALRRRFLWKEIKAYEDEKSLAVLLSRMNEQTDIKESMETLAKAIINMNKIISGESGDGVNGSYFQLNESYQIGAAYFKKYNGKRSGDDEGGGASLGQIWEGKIEPTLREYVRGYDKTKVDEFIKNCKQALLPKEGKENKNSEKANSADAARPSEEQDLENAEENDEE